MSRQCLPVSHYELKLYQKYGQPYLIIPNELWHGVRTSVTIHCVKHKSQRPCWLQKIFNGRMSLWPCRQCWLDSLKNQTVIENPKSWRGTLVPAHSPTDTPPAENGWENV